MKKKPEPIKNNPKSPKAIDVDQIDLVKWILIESRVDDQFVHFTVSDSGPGIPEEIKDKVMESFFTTKPLGKGSGLGLALVKRFVQEHHGNLAIVKINGKNFISFSLPLKTHKKNVA